ncbi:MAG: hypothetical protein J7M18_06230 [Candidatus Eremiobacteraeota bacterium]|nr:hypothetical protein [Candidatus Eremiobacteraeota bacterium]
MAGEIDKVQSMKLDHKVFERNVQHVGRQAELIKKKEADQMASARDTLELHDIFRERDHVDITKDGQKAAQHTGLLQDLARDKKAEKRQKALETKSLKEAKAKEEVSKLKDKLAKVKESAKPPVGEAEPPAGKASSAKGAPSAGGKPSTTGTFPVGGMSAAPLAPGQSATAAATQYKAVQDDIQGAQKIFVEMMAARQKWFMDIWKIISDLQTHILETVQSVLVNRSKAMNRIIQKWDEFIRGE